MGKRKTTHIRVYRDDLLEVKTKFPRIRTADFFHQAVKTNPFLQVEAILRGKKPKKRQKR